jgi:hypothetical protein
MVVGNITIMLIMEATDRKGECTGKAVRKGTVRGTDSSGAYQRTPYTQCCNQSGAESHTLPDRMSFWTHPCTIPVHSRFPIWTHPCIIPVHAASPSGRTLHNISTFKISHLDAPLHNINIYNIVRLPRPKFLYQKNNN